MSSITKSIARKIIFPLFLKTGITNKIACSSNKNTLILNYHGVLPTPNFELTPNHISTEDFEREISYFAANFNIIHPEQLHSGTIIPADPRKKNIIITFDDGYANNFNYAFPILKKFNAPAIIFPVTSLIDSNDSTWYDKIDLTLATINDKTIQTKLNPILQEINKKQVVAISRSNLKTIIKQLTSEQKEVFFEEYFKYADKSPLTDKFTADFRKILTSNQIIKMQHSGLMCFGSHTHTHPNLDTLSDYDVNFELKSSRDILSNITGQAITSIAFPDGAYNQQVKDAAKTIGFQILYAVNFRLKEDLNDKQIFQRFSISNTTTASATIFHASRNFQKLGFIL